MATGSTTTFASLLKEVIASDLYQDQVNRGTFLTDCLQSGSQMSPGSINMSAAVEGKWVRVPVLTDYNQNAAVGVSPGFTYPVGGVTTSTEAKFRCRPIVASMQWQNEVVSRSQSSDQSVKQFKAHELADLQKTIKWRTNFDLHRDGSGLLATHNTYTQSGAVVNLSSGINNIKPGMEIILRTKISGNAAGAPTTTGLPTAWPVVSIATGDPMLVSSTINYTASTFVPTYQDGSAWTSNFAGDSAGLGVYHHDNQGRQMWGISNVCDSANPANNGYNGATTVTAVEGGTGTSINASFGAIDRTVAGNEFWKGQTATELGISSTNMASAVLTIEDHWQLFATAVIRKDDTLYNQDSLLAVMEMPVWWSLVNQLESGKRTALRSEIVDGKYGGVRYNMFTFCHDHFAESATVKVFAPRYLYRMILTPWALYSAGGVSEFPVLGGLNRMTSVKRLHLLSEQNLLANRCNQNFMLTNVGS